MAKSDNLTSEYIKSILEYDPDTGVFKWLINKKNVTIGQKAGSISAQGYNRISINNVSYRSARLAFLYMTGSWPEDTIDHINTNRSDDRWCNLRPASVSENNKNKSLMRNNTSGYRGVSFNKRLKKWKAKIGVNKKVIELGIYPTKQLACEAYRQASEKYHGEFGKP